MHSPVEKREEEKKLRLNIFTSHLLWNIFFSSLNAFHSLHAHSHHLALSCLVIPYTVLKKCIIAEHQPTINFFQHVQIGFFMYIFTLYKREDITCTCTAFKTYYSSVKGSIKIRAKNLQFNIFFFLSAAFSIPHCALYTDTQCIK